LKKFCQSIFVTLRYVFIRIYDIFCIYFHSFYFLLAQLTSFQRQLNLYGFRRVTKGPDQGAYRHEDFHRDRPEISRQMKRAKQKNNLQSGRPRSNSTTSASSAGSPALSLTRNNSLSEVPDFCLSDNKSMRQRHRSMSLGQIEGKGKTSTALGVLMEHKTLKSTKVGGAVSSQHSGANVEYHNQALVLASAGLVAEEVHNFGSYNHHNPVPSNVAVANPLSSSVDDPTHALTDLLLTNSFGSGIVDVNNMDLDLDFSQMFEAEHLGP